MTISELKAQAQELGLTKEFVSGHGDLRKKQTWESAIAFFQSESESETEQKPGSINLENATIGVITEVTEEDIESGVDFEPLAEPEVISITCESNPKIWQHLEPPTEPETIPATYQVITEQPNVTTYSFSPPQKKTWLRYERSEESLHKRSSEHQKLPFQDFFAWLFSPPAVSLNNQ